MTITFDHSAMKKDFTPTNIRIEGQYENDRNACFADLYKAMLREVYDVKDVIIAHHLVYVKEDKRPDGFKYQIVQEVPSADTLIFDHDVMEKLFGTDFKTVLAQLACEPAESRDELLAKLYYGRTQRYQK